MQCKKTVSVLQKKRTFAQSVLEIRGET